MGLAWSQARDVIGYELAKANGWDPEEGDSYADWLLREARRASEIARA